MSIIQHFVSPKLPTVQVDDARVDLPGHDANIYYVDFVYVIPTELDVSKFEDALSRVLQVYPHAAGQLRRDDGRWSIELTNSSVPVVIEYKLDTSTDLFLEGNWVLQNDLSPLLNQHPTSADLVDSSAPLLRLKLTFFENETCIGVSWHHSLGDSIAIFRLLHTLSQFYQGLPSEFAPPTFKKHHFPAPSRSILAELSSRMPLHPFHPFDAVETIKAWKLYEHVRWRFDVHDLEELRSALSSRQKMYLSKQDCLTAYVVAVLNHNRSDAVQCIKNLASYRHVQASFIAENVAGNLLLFVPAGALMDMGETASAVRNALVQAREPHCISLLESVKSACVLERFNAGHPAAFVPQAHELWVDSYVVIDWWSAHFGFPNGTRFHASGFFNYCVKYFGSNPTKGEDGVWQSRPSIEISMGVTVGLKSKILETLEQGIKYTFDQQDAYFDLCRECT